MRLLYLVLLLACSSVSAACGFDAAGADQPTQDHPQWLRIVPIAAAGDTSACLTSGMADHFFAKWQRYYAEREIPNASMLVSCQPTAREAHNWWAGGPSYPGWLRYFTEGRRYPTVGIVDGPPYFSPRKMVYNEHEPFRWENQSSDIHTVTFDGCAYQPGVEDCLFDSGPLWPGQSYMADGLPQGTYRYHCRIHPVMRGELVVVQGKEL